ncbi:ribonuclease III [Patescibacteria group bacterium]|nr:ribonuclease III [Patescibacteria group bacterium]MCL5797469.1 ribonuclease III [Patescibacteria group bacterium]
MKLNDLAQKVDLAFKDNNLIQQAFIHRSYLNENKEFASSNERLEFLGDSILSLLVSEYLFKEYPDFSEGQLTNLRSSVVKTTTLAQIAKELRLGGLLLLSHGEEEGGGRQNTSILADTFEAFLGAVFLDQGLLSAKKILSVFLFPLLTNILRDKKYKDAKSEFQEIVQEDKKVSPVYKVLDQKGPDHAKEFTIGVYVENILYGTGQGKSKQEGEMKAAEEALNKWQAKK